MAVQECGRTEAQLWARCPESQSKVFWGVPKQLSVQTWLYPAPGRLNLTLPSPVELPDMAWFSFSFLSFQNKDGSYTGFIKVQLKLVRPVSVPSSKKPPSLQDARRGTGRSTAVKRRTSFYLPKDAIKHLHVLSRTRAREVIEALLRKFMVVDDPRKFALFERTERHGQGRFPVSALPV